jgi:phage-related protein (TIGR01555 family)
VDRRGASRYQIKADAVMGTKGQPKRTELVPPIPHPVVLRDEIFKPAAVPKALKAAGVEVMAADDQWFPDYGYANFNEGIGFFGYPLLAEMSQRVEFRKMVETLAMDMTREWVRFTYSGDSDKSDVIGKIEAAFTTLKVKEIFRKAAELDGFFGRGHVYLDLGTTDKEDELGTPLILKSAKIKKGALKAIRVVDPSWVYPGGYNSSDPLMPTYYRPEHWYVMNKKVHHTRLMTMILRPVPDMLKPAYSFGGMSMTQLAKPYVDNWLRTRQSISDIVHSFTVWVLKTDLSSVLQGGDAETVNSRLDIFNNYRDNRGIFALNMGEGGPDTGEQFENVSAPLAGLNDLQSGAQEQLSMVSGIPLVKLLGTTPSGLNASSDGEVRVYYDAIAAAQERLFRDPMEVLLKVVQLSEFGAIDEDISFEFKPLWQLDETELATARKADADVDVGYVNAGVLDPVEVRGKLASDKTSVWANLDVDKVPEPPEQPGEEFGEEDDEPGGQDSWNEGDHPRASNGEFGAGGSTSVGAGGEIMHQGEKVGRVKLDKSGPAYRIADIEISGSHQGKGIGSSVIKAIQAEARKAGKAVVLSTDAMRGKIAQQGQRRLYSRLGFVPNTGPNRVTEKVGKKTIAEELVWFPDRHAEDSFNIAERFELRGLKIAIEHPMGATRTGGEGERAWQSIMAADYGYIEDTWSAEGRGEQIDCFVGPNRESKQVFVIDQLDLETRQFDEHKLMLGFDDGEAAIDAYCASYDSRGADRIIAVTPCTIPKLKVWLERGDLYRPFSKSDV